ncbi:MAG: AMP-binding enzyme, partial [Solirubrobacterales bacterium]
GLGIADGYGQTETGAVAGVRPDEDDPAKDGSMGRPLPGVEIRVVPARAQGTPGSEAGDVPPDAGELHVRPASVTSFFSRYLDGEPFAGEWWATGDHVRRDGDGHLWFEGRDDDIILSAGYRIGPFEVESALVSHPAVAEAAAIAAPDDERGSIVRAIVVLRDGEPSDALATELQEHVKRTTAPYKYPRIVEFASELPKTPSGKIRRAELRAG